MTLEKKKDYFVFIVGLMALFKFRILGTFSGAEILAYISYFVIDWKQFKRNKKVVTLLKMAFLWLMGVIIADIFNHTDTVNALKGAFNVVFLIALIPFVYWAMHDKPSRWMWFAAGSAIATLASYYTGAGLEKAEGSISDMLVWRVYFYYPAALICASILYYKGYHKLSYILIELFGLWSLSFASRNIFLAQTIAVVVLLYIDSFKDKQISSKINKYRRKIVGLLLALGIGAAISAVVYEDLAASGALGDRVYEKYMMQKYAKGGLASGRSDSFISICLIAQNPIIGYGSYATNKDGMVNRIAAEYGLEHDLTRDDLLPGHSHILGAWVYAGLLGGVYWIYVLVYLIKIFKSGILLADPPMLGHRVYFTMMNVWNIMFSPFQGRMAVLLLIINLMILEKSYKTNL